MKCSRGWARKAGWVGGAVLLVMMAAPVGASADDELGNMVFFRGGYVQMFSDRSNEIFTDTQNVLGQGNNPGDYGWYVGAGLDLILSKDSWGAMSKTWVVGEIGLQFSRFTSETVTSAVPALTAVAGIPLGGGTTPAMTQLTMVTIDVAPKIKFMEGSRFRPWIIPVGLDIHVISPPSNQTQYLDVGVQFGAGFEFQLWRAFKLGADARYHLTANLTNTTNNYWQVGPYVGISF